MCLYTRLAHASLTPAIAGSHLEDSPWRLRVVPTCRVASGTAVMPPEARLCHNETALSESRPRAATSPDKSEGGWNVSQCPAEGRHQMNPVA